MSFTLPFLLGPVFFRTALPCSGGYHLERVGIPLHDVVGMNCKTGATTENQRVCVKWSICQGVYVDDCVCVVSYLISLPLLGGGKKSLYIVYINTLQYTKLSGWSIHDGNITVGTNKTHILLKNVHRAAFIFDTSTDLLGIEKN